MHIVITDQENENLVKEEVFLGNQYTVISRSGLNITEIQIIEAIRGLANPKRILFLENRTGVSGIIARGLYPEAEILVLCWQNQEKLVKKQGFLCYRLL
ncbi:MAG: hypothetical protein HW406_1539 [Candidatus Brocadiaceae bacterium]|nr:hypothetical protein [Candidatus Brocadiaceae bacterium]